MISFFILSFVCFILSMVIGIFTGFVFQKICDEILDNTIMGWKLEILTVMTFATLAMIAEIVIPAIVMTSVLS